VKFGIFFRLVFFIIYGKSKIILSLEDKRLQPLSLSLISTLFFLLLVANYGSSGKNEYGSATPTKYV